MRIIIPTKGRMSNQLTISNLPPELQKVTTIVSPQVERYWHEQNWPLAKAVAQPDDKMGIAEKRKWIIDVTSYERIVMLDDDLRFAVRRDDDPGKFRKAEPEDVLLAFTQLKNQLTSECPHAGFAVRGGGIGEQAKAGGWQFTGKRMMYSLGYHIPTVRAKAIFGRIGTHEDMDITLQLLRQGLPNAVNFSFVTDQAFGKKGGCTEERTVEKNNLDVLELARLHPGYVRVTEKQYKASVPRLEVVCAWQQCLKDGLRDRQLREPVA